MLSLALVTAYLFVLTFAVANAKPRPRPQPGTTRFLAEHTNAVLRAKCRPTYASLAGPRRLWIRRHRLAHRAKKGSCVPWPSWWYGQAMCIHRNEAVDWHEKRNPSSRGGMQIQYGTWAGVGGHGDPADASPFEQLYRAWLIWKRDGGSWREWTTAGKCGLA